MNAPKIKLFFNRYWILLLLITVKFILQYTLVNPVYELHRDEFLHLDQAFHPSAGYISTPPFTSWISGLIYFLGGGLFWIRFFPAFFGVLTIVFAWLIVEESGGKLQAKILTSIFLIFSIYTRMNVLFQPNSFDILAWTFIFYFLIKYLKNNEGKWLFLLSAAIALGLYNKYTLGFLILGLFAGLLLTEHRVIFTRKVTYYAIGLSLLLFVPNILWQIKNHFPVIYHMQALKESQLVNINRSDFLFDQVKYGVVGISTIAAFWAMIFYRPLKTYRFVLFTFITVILLFTISRAKSYYSLGLYPVLFAFGSVYLENLFGKWRTALISLLAIINIVIFFTIVKYLMPFQYPTDIIADKESYERLGLLRWEDGKNHPLPQDFADMLGWREMAEKSLTAYKMIPADELKNTLIYCENYGQTGALNYFNRKKMPEASSFKTDYIYWLPGFDKIKNVVYVGNLPDKEIIDMFKEYKLVGVVENEFARERNTKIFLLIGANPNFTEEFYKTAEERKRTFDLF